MIVVASTQDLDGAKLCFDITGPTGYLNLEVPHAYQVQRHTNHTVHATATVTDNKRVVHTETVTLDKNSDTIVAGLGMGEHKGDATLIELRVSSGPGASPASASNSNGAPSSSAHQRFLVKFDIGLGTRSCSGVLVAPQWALTAASCFAPAPGVVVAPGAPAQPVTATVGRTDLTSTTGQVEAITHLVPHPQRNLALAKLANPVAGIAPTRLAAGAPTPGEVLQVAGYGRTNTTWVPNAAHAAAFTVGAANAETLTVTGQTGICKGDAGGPAFRLDHGRPALVGLAQASWQGGCVGEDPGARRGGLLTRTDDVVGWIGSHASVCAPVSIRSVQKGTPVDGNGRYVSAELGREGWEEGMLRATATSVGPAETFDRCLITDEDGTYHGMFGLRAVTGQWITVEANYKGDAQYMLRAVTGETMPEAGVFSSPEPHSLYAVALGTYVSTELGYKNDLHAMLRARANHHREWETWQIS